MVGVEPGRPRHASAASQGAQQAYNRNQHLIMQHLRASTSGHFRRKLVELLNGGLAIGRGSYLLAVPKGGRHRRYNSDFGMLLISSFPMASGGRSPYTETAGDAASACPPVHASGYRKGNQLKQSDKPPAGVPFRPSAAERDLGTPLAKTARDSGFAAPAAGRFSAAMEESPRMVAQRATNATLQASPRMEAQQERLQNLFGPRTHIGPPLGTGAPLRRGEPLQRRTTSETVARAEPQPEATATAPAEAAANVTPGPNLTGLPDALKGSVESLSGMSLDGVKVHYN